MPLNKAMMKGVKLPLSPSGYGFWEGREAAKTLVRHNTAQQVGLLRFPPFGGNMKLIYLLAGVVVAAAAYETVVYVVNRRQPELYEDARRQRVRQLNHDGDLEGL